MGTYLFKWEHPASEVYVTGNFDDWAKSIKLDHVSGSHFEKLVTLPKLDGEENYIYKFVVDGVWTTDHNAPQHNDDSGNVNNILTPDHIQQFNASSSMLSSVGAGSTTAALAGGVPLEGSRDLPGAFPTTPGLETGSFSVNPLPSTAGPGNPDPGEVNARTIHSSVTTDKESYERAANDAPQSFSVNPLPATSGAGNPVNLPAGAPVPPSSQFTTNTVGSGVTLDKESYERGTGAPVLPDVVPENERGLGMFGLATNPGPLIPESSLPMGAGVDNAILNPHISSAGPGTSTAALAGAVPLEPRGRATVVDDSVPEVVQESQAMAGASSEASANPQAVDQKNAVEDELTSKVPEARSTEDGSTVSGKVAEIAAGVAASATAAVAAATAYVSDKAPQVKESLPESVQKPIDQMTGNTATTSATPIASTVPDPVQESLAESHMAPEAAANPTAVAEKSQVEQELLASVPKDNSLGESAPAASSYSNAFNSTPIVSTVPDPVQESLAQSHISPEAAANPSAVAEKSQMEHELLSTIPKNTSLGEPAPAATASSDTFGAIPIASTVPDPVQESLAESHMSPEAAANPAAVANKSDVESELLSSVSPAQASSQPVTSSSHGYSGLGAAGVAAAAGAIAGGGIYAGTHHGSQAPASTVPEIVQESLEQAHESPEASASRTAVAEKSAMESELLSSVRPAPESSGVPAPTTSAALSSTAPGSLLKSTETPLDNTPGASKTGLNASALSPAVPATSMGKTTISRDVSPLTKPSAGPTVTTGVGSSSMPATSSSKPTGTTTTISSGAAAPVTPQKNTSMAQAAAQTAASKSSQGAIASSSPAAKSSPASGADVASPTSVKTSGTTDSKSKRKSGFFSKLKAKMSHKKDEDEGSSKA